MNSDDRLENTAWQPGLAFPRQGHLIVPHTIRVGCKLDIYPPEKRTFRFHSERLKSGKAKTGA